MNNCCIIKINKETNESCRRALIKTSALIGCFNEKKMMAVSWDTSQWSSHYSHYSHHALEFVSFFSSLPDNCQPTYIYSKIPYVEKQHTYTHDHKHTHNHTHTHNAKAHAPVLITASIHQCIPPLYAYAEHRIVSDHIKSSGNNR